MENRSEKTLLSLMFRYNPKQSIVRHIQTFSNFHTNAVMMGKEANKAHKNVSVLNLQHLKLSPFKNDQSLVD